MNSREKILEAVLKNQPETTVLPDISMFKGENIDTVQKYMEVFKSIFG
jgi:L-lactate dehydrogenase complex protein LldG